MTKKERRKLGISRIDTHIYARENNWAIKGITYLYMATGNTSYLNQAITAANWVIKNRSFNDGGFSHDNISQNTQTYLGDTLAMGEAFLALYQATTDKKYLQLSQTGLDFINHNFKNPLNNPGYISFNVQKGEALIANPKRLIIC
jgi:uncharacterized protein YyaL (SSP411 family)